MNLETYELVKNSKHFITLMLDDSFNILESNKTFRLHLNFDETILSVHNYLQSKAGAHLDIKQEKQVLYPLNNDHIYFDCVVFKQKNIIVIGEIYLKEEMAVLEQMSKINGKLASATRELHKKNSLLQQAYDDLAQKEKMLLTQSRSAAMNELLIMLAHQWRQPLNKITLNSIIIEELISNSEFRIPNVNKYLEKIQGTSKKLSDTITLFSEKLGNEKKEPYNVDLIIKDTYNITNQTFINNNIEFKTIYNNNSLIDIVPSILIQIVLIIIQNSLDAFEKIDSLKKEFVIETKEDEDSIYIEISDNAGGIDDDILLKVFEPYFSTKVEQNDVGLGLYIAKLLSTKVLSGSINIENKNSGVCNTIIIPKTLGVENG